MKLITFITLLLLGTSAWAAQAKKIAGYAGETTGGVAFAFNKLGQKRKLGARVPIYEGETLITSKTANSSVIFVDGTTIELNPATQFRVEEFKYGKDEEKPSAVFQMLKGGFRFISGLVNKSNGGKLAFKTPTATIGIRGSAGAFGADGTIEVYEGTFTVVTGNGASTNLNQGQTANTASGTVKKTKKMSKAAIQKRLNGLKAQQKSVAAQLSGAKSMNAFLAQLGLGHLVSDTTNQQQHLDNIEAQIEQGKALLKQPVPTGGGTAYCPASPAILITDPRC